jgi:hypothetical protein
VKPLPIVPERTAKINYECRKIIVAGKLFIRIIWVEPYENYDYRADFYFKLRIIKVFKITRQICKKFFLLGM